MALISKDFDELLTRAAQAVAPYRGIAVLAGGCASALFRYHPASAAPAPRPLLTTDADIAVPAAGLPAVPSLHGRLTGLGLVLVPSNRPANTYKVSPDANEAIEILCPMTGLPRAVKERAPALVDIQSGTRAEALDYLEILLVNPWSVDLAEIPELALAESLTAYVPNPVAYVLQKMLIRRRRRTPVKRQKDCYYTYEAAVLFRNALDRLASEAGLLRQEILQKWYRDGMNELRRVFGHESAEGVFEAVDVGRAAGIDVNAAMVYRTVAQLTAAIA